jgi:hypothetical protein
LVVAEGSTELFGAKAPGFPCAPLDRAPTDPTLGAVAAEPLAGPLVVPLPTVPAVPVVAPLADALPVGSTEALGTNAPGLPCAPLDKAPTVPVVVDVAPVDAVPVDAVPVDAAEPLVVPVPVVWAEAPAAVSAAAATSDNALIMIVSPKVLINASMLAGP